MAREIGGDDHAGFERPRRRTRPRTKTRPDYSAADLARVITVDRGRYDCLLGDRLIRCTKARQLGRHSVIVGDQVAIVGDTSAQAGTLARIVEVRPRTSVLRRSADDTDPYERAIVANATQLVVVTALADPPPRTGMIDRILVAGYDAGLAAVLCLTKADLAAPDALVAAYEPLGVQVIVSKPGADLAPLRAILAGQSSVFVGHSGVGKSTLVNALVPSADRQIGVVNAVTGRGRHTSTSAIALELPAPGGWVIDTPGVRSFGLAGVDVQRIITGFADLAAASEHCPRGCSHLLDAPGCGLDRAVADGGVSADRVASFRRMITARQTGHG